MKAKAAAGPLKKRIFKQMKDHYALLLFMLPPIVWIILFRYVPMAGVQIAFRKFSPQGGIWGSEWVGMANFAKFFASHQFSKVMINTVRISLYTLAASFPIPIILALSFNAMRSSKLRKLVQTTLYLPHFISIVVLVGILLQIMNVRTGLIPQLYTSLTGRAATDYLAKSGAFPHLYVWSGIWQNMGWNTIIYTAALSSVDMELHEAAEIDGASRFQRVLYIDFPSILPTAIIMLILSAGNVMSVGFEKVYLMQNPLNLSTSEVISTFTYKIGMAAGKSDYSYSTAIGLFNSLINLFMLSAVNLLSRRYSETSLW